MASRAARASWGGHASLQPSARAQGHAATSRMTRWTTATWSSSPSFARQRAGSVVVKARSALLMSPALVVRTHPCCGVAVRWLTTTTTTTALQCDMQTSRCATAASLSHGPDEARLIAHAQRQASAAANGKSTTIGSGKTHDRTRPRQACPYEAPLVCMAYDRTGTKLSPRCTSPQRDVRNCGGCSGSFALLSGGESSVLAEGQDCAAIPGALATSCRAGKCFVHACQQGFYLDDETATCVRAPADDDDVDLI